MNIMVTGCAGFIGSNFVDAWLDAKRDSTVIGVDALTYASSVEHNALAQLTGRFLFVNENILATDNIIAHVRACNVQCIVNFAAETHVDNSIVDCKRFIESNVHGVASLLNVCRVTNARIVHISSDEVYGPRDKEFPAYENCALSPSNPYAATKAAADHLINAFINTYGIDACIVRLTNNFGPRQHIEKLIPRSLSLLLSGMPLQLYGDGTHVREWTYVIDCVNAISQIVNNHKQRGIVNIPGQFRVTNLMLAHRLISIVMGSDNDEMIEHITDRPGHDHSYSIATMHDVYVLNDRSFDDALRSTLSWYAANR